MENFRTDTAHGDRAASFSMLLATFCYSFVPLLLVALGGTESPFLFNAVYRFGAVIGAGVFLFAFYREFILSGSVLTLIWQRLKNRTIALVIVPYFGYTAFAWSVRYVDVSLTTIVQEIWPVLFILFTERLMRRENRFRRPTLGQIGLVAFCFIGFAFVVNSKDGTFWQLDLISKATLIGVGLAILSAFIISSTSYNFRWAANLRNELMDCAPRPSSTFKVELFCLMVAFLIGSTVSAIVNMCAGMLVDRHISINETDWQYLILGALVGGALLDALGTVLNRTANLVTSNLGVNAIAYATPLLGLVWLYAFWNVGIQQYDYLVIGAAAIVSANLLLNFEAERLVGFKALVLALWACGAVVYLRDAIQPDWTGVGSGYFEALALSATVFTLILSFRVARLANRTRDEDNRTFVLLYEMKALSGRRLISPAICEHILTIDSAQGPEMQKAYAEARRYIAAALRRAGRADRDKLVAAQADLDALAHSRQQGINFGELCALFIFAGITVGLALSLRPASSGLTAFLVEMFTMLFSSVIVFLAVNVVDLQRDRSARILRRSDAGDYTLVFQGSARRHIEQGITIAVGIAIVAAYAALLGHKWLNWFGGGLNWFGWLSWFT